jgi:hypothetical protein
VSFKYILFDATVLKYDKWIELALTPKGQWEPKRLFSFLGRLLWMNSIFRNFETFCGGRYEWELSNETLHVTFGLMVQKLW